tara:strand:- start:5436 stop:6215 length:780 start_codon:yes stop_codon:yes gene_type:complete
MMKDTNPKDAIGTAKWRQFMVVPRQVLWEVGVGMLEGALKYGRHNYRGAGVRASVYCDAALGHIEQFIEGEDIDEDSGLSHITKAICSLVVLRDAMMNDFYTDDRPPKIKDVQALRERLGLMVEQNFARYADKDPHHYTNVEDGAPYQSFRRLNIPMSDEDAKQQEIDASVDMERDIRAILGDNASAQDIAAIFGPVAGTASIVRVGEIAESTIKFHSARPTQDEEAMATKVSGIQLDEDAKRKLGTRRSGNAVPRGFA